MSKLDDIFTEARENIVAGVAGLPSNPNRVTTKQQIKDLFIELIQDSYGKADLMRRVKEL